jgi:outer membrane protein OmpA-like peptidoglycan-associated protein
MKVPSNMQPGDVLAQADLASYIGAMAKGVAEAQKALDDNTIGLLGEFTQPIPGLGSKSLMQLGLSPAFYHFRSATISASVSMTLRVREEIEVAVHLGIGGSQDSSAASTSSFKETTSAHGSVSFSDQFVAESKASQNASAMEAIDSYAESSTATHFVVAERVAVAASDKMSLQEDGLVRYNQEADLFVVPPQGKYWAVFGFVTGSAASDAFQIKAQQSLAPGPISDRKALAAAIKQQLTGQIDSVYMLSGDGSAADLTQVLFENNSYLVNTVAGADYQVRLRALARIIAAAGLGTVVVTGYTDGVGPTDYNLRLSELRAKSVRAILVANGVAVDAPIGRGEQGVSGQQADPSRRKVEISFVSPLPGCFLYFEDAQTVFDPQMGPPGSASVNGLRGSALYPANGTGINGKSAVSSAHELHLQFSDSAVLEASHSGELVYVTYKKNIGKDVAKVQVYRDQSSSQTTQQQSNFQADQDEAADTALTQAAGTKVNRASAVVASLDARYARMFDLTMSGNMSIAAELVSIPAPPEFLQFIKDYLED